MELSAVAFLVRKGPLGKLFSLAGLCYLARLSCETCTVLEFAISKRSDLRFHSAVSFGDFSEIFLRLISLICFLDGLLVGSWKVQGLISIQNERDRNEIRNDIQICIVFKGR